MRPEVAALLSECVDCRQWARDSKPGSMAWHSAMEDLGFVQRRLLHIRQYGHDWFPAYVERLKDQANNREVR